jgi:hypothetical protein
MAVKRKDKEARTDQQEICLTYHAAERLNQRQFSATQIAYVLKHGQALHRTGIVFYFLGAKDVPVCDRHVTWIQRLIGTTILVSAENEVIITIYRNKGRAALQDIKKKTKFRATWQSNFAYNKNIRAA